MSNFPKNYVATSVTYLNIAGGTDVYDLQPITTLFLMPLPGYTLLAGNLSWTGGLSEVDTVTFTQQGDSVYCTITFVVGYTMPYSDVEIAVNVNGIAELKQYEVSGDVVLLSGDIYLGEGAATEFQAFGNYNDYTLVWEETVSAQNNKYFTVPPTLTQVSGDNSIFFIAYENFLDVYGNINQRKISLYCMFENYDSVNNVFNIDASVANVYNPDAVVTNYHIENPYFPLAGGSSIMTLYGVEGASWTLTAVDSILQTQATDPVTGEYIYSTNTNGVISATGSSTVLLKIPSSIAQTIRDITIGGDLVFPFDQPNPAKIYQADDVTITYAPSIDDYFVVDGFRTNTGASLSSPGIGDDGYSNNFTWVTNPFVSPYKIFIARQPIASDFDSTDYTTNGGSNFGFNSLTATFINDTTVNVNVTGFVEKYGGNNVTANLYLLNFLGVIRTSPVTNISDTQATGNGDIIFPPGTEVTSRGFCWNTSTNPTVANSIITAGAGQGPFQTLLTGLTPETNYYVRAFVYNSLGAVYYGNEVTFITLDSGE
jgi:hypothetical protein